MELNGVLLCPELSSLLLGLRILVVLGGIWGQNKGKASVFNGSVVYFNVGIGLTFLGRSCSTRQNFTCTYFEEKKWPLNAVEILCPEVNVSPPHKNQTISFRRCTPL
jgi:hypothetical protein